MTRDEMRAWAWAGMEGDRDNAPFWDGVLMAALGFFDDSECAPAGHVDESLYCEGGREGRQRLAEPAPAGRLKHGERVEVP